MPKVSRRTATFIAAGLVVLHAVLAWVVRSPGIATGRDDARYLLLGRALRGLTYRELWRPDGRFHALYPPGYPAALAIWGGIFGERFDVLILLNVLASAATLLILFLVVRRRWGDVLALCALAPLAVNPHLVEQAGNLASEPLFMLLSVGALAMLAADDPTLRARIAASALALAAVMTRSAGVPIVGALIVLWLVERRWRFALGFTAAAGVVLGGWFWWTVRFADRAVGESYVADASFIGQDNGGMLGRLNDMSQRAADYLARSVPSVMQAPTLAGTIADNVIVTTIAAITLAAGAWVLWRSWRAATLFLLATAGLLLVWTWHLTRYLVPLSPLLVACMMVGAAWLAGRVRPAAAPFAAAILSIVMTVTGVVHTRERQRADTACPRGQTPPAASCLRRDVVSYLDAALYLRDSVPAGAVILSVKPEPVYLYSGHKALAGRSLVDEEHDLVDRLRAEHVGWVLLGSVHSTEVLYLQPGLMKRCSELSALASFPTRTWVLRVLPAGAPPDSSGCAAMESYRRASIGRDFWHDR